MRLNQAAKLCGSRGARLEKEEDENASLRSLFQPQRQWGLTTPETYRYKLQAVMLEGDLVATHSRRLRAQEPPALLVGILGLGNAPVPERTRVWAPLPTGGVQWCRILLGAIRAPEKYPASFGWGCFPVGSHDLLRAETLNSLRHAAIFWLFFVNVT